MAQPSSPTVWRRWLALELRRLRVEAGLKQKEAGDLCGWSGARLSYIEAGKQDVREDDLDKLLPLYGVPEESWADYYLAAERSREREWWERYERDLSDRAQANWSLYLGLEQGAAKLQAFELSVVPGLLQTREYAEELFRRTVWPRTEPEIDRLVDLRIKRQSILTRREQPPRYEVVLDEAVLRRVAKNEATMAEQINHLVSMAELPNISIRLIPLERGAYAYSPTNFVLLEFAWGSDSMVAQVELRDQSFYFEGNDIKGFVLAFHKLWEIAHTEGGSLAMLRALAKEYSKN